MKSILDKVARWSSSATKQRMEVESSSSNFISLNASGSSYLSKYSYYFKDYVDDGARYRGKLISELNKHEQTEMIEFLLTYLGNCNEVAINIYALSFKMI